MIDNYARVTILKPVSKRRTLVSKIVNTQYSDVGIVSVVSGSSLEPVGEAYDGAYSVEPSFDTQTLPTSGCVLQDDITVAPIGVSITSNLSGGNTVYIGPI